MKRVGGRGGGGAWLDFKRIAFTFGEVGILLNWILEFLIHYEGATFIIFLKFLH